MQARLDELFKPPSRWTIILVVISFASALALILGVQFKFYTVIQHSADLALAYFVGIAAGIFALGSAAIALLQLFFAERTFKLNVLQCVLSLEQERIQVEQLRIAVEALKLQLANPPKGDMHFALFNIPGPDGSKESRASFNS